MNPLRLNAIELVGLRSPENGRACGIHECCGLQVEQGHEIILRGDSITIVEEVEKDVPVNEENPAPKKKGRPKKHPTVKVKVMETRIEPVNNF